MTAAPRRSVPNALKQLWGLIFGLLSSDSLKLVIDAVQLFRSMVHEQAEGLYEVLEFEHTLELCDAQGHKAIYHKRETVRLLQDHVAAYVDQAWGRGEIFAEYRCSPGTPVDHYRCGHRHCVLISLREIKRRGDEFRIAIDRTILNGFDVETGWSETMVRHKTRQFRIAVVFPVERSPKNVELVEVNRNRTTHLGATNTQTLPDGRREVYWETEKPTLFETYTLKWTW